jgi:hypothetical protein
MPQRLFTHEDWRNLYEARCNLGDATKDACALVGCISFLAARDWPYAVELIIEEHTLPVDADS